MTLKQLTVLAKGVYRKLQISATPKLRKIKSPKNFNLHGYTYDNGHLYYIQMTRKSGEPYTDRFLISVLCHEIAHRYAGAHNEVFRKHQRRISRILRRLVKSAEEAKK